MIKPLFRILIRIRSVLTTGAAGHARTVGTVPYIDYWASAGEPRSAAGRVARAALGRGASRSGGGGGVGDMRWVPH
jgi:hypothetical protein